MRLPFFSSLDKTKKFIKPLQLWEAETETAIGKVCSFLREVISTTVNFRKNAFDLIPPEKTIRAGESVSRSIRESVYQPLLFSSYRRVKKIKQTKKLNKQKNEYKPKKQDDFSCFSFKKNHHKM